MNFNVRIGGAKSFLSVSIHRQKSCYPIFNEVIVKEPAIA
jgi:hypothetical protein